MHSEVEQPAEPGMQIGQHFFDRLTDLLELRSAERHRPVTNIEIAAWMTEHGYPVSDSYISSLRLGYQRHPSLKIIEGLAAYFDVAAPTLISADTTRAMIDTIARDTGATNLALRATGLSAENLELVSKVLDSMRVSERLSSHATAPDESASNSNSETHTSPDEATQG